MVTRIDMSPIVNANATEAYRDINTTNPFNNAEAREAMFTCGTAIKHSVGHGEGCNQTTAWLNPFENPGLNRQVGGNVESKYRAHEDVTQGFHLIA